MDRLFNLRSDLAPSAASDGDDVILAKQFLADTGDFEVPGYGITEYPDSALFDGIKRFQARNKLATDGIMRAGGPTEGALDRHLRETRWKPVERIRSELERRCRGLAPAMYLPGLPFGSAACKQTKDECDMQFDRDILECSQIAKGNRKIFAICEHTAMDRLAACVRGKPLPPLYRGQ